MLKSPETDPPTPTTTGEPSIGSDAWYAQPAAFSTDGNSQLAGSFQPTKFPQWDSEILLQQVWAGGIPWSFLLEAISKKCKTEQNPVYVSLIYFHKVTFLPGNTQ